MDDYTKLRACELFLFDMDGTLYLGDDVYDGAIALMEDLPALGKRYIYLTNNSSRAGTDYIIRLRRLGFPCEAENVFTSGMATGMYLNQNYPSLSYADACRKTSLRLHQPSANPLDDHLRWHEQCNDHNSYQLLYHPDGTEKRQSCT